MPERCERLLEIGARAEGPPFAREQNRSNRGVVPGARERRAERADELGVERVHRGGAVQSEDPNLVIRLFDEARKAGHCREPTTAFRVRC